MSYLKFDRRLMSNLDESLQYEQLRTNRMGAYSCSSIVGCNTRKYHGLLVVPIPELSPNNHVLLSSLDLTIIQHDAPFNIAVHEYKGDVFSPKGNKYIREYNVDVTSSTTYRVGGVVMRREHLFCHFQHRIILKYTLLEAHSKTQLKFSPFLAFRDVKMLTHKNANINEAYDLVKGGIRTRLYDTYPDLFMQFTAEDIDFISEPHWNENIAYLKERERGYEYLEDLYVPGYFTCSIKKNKPVYFTAGLEEINPEELEILFNREVAERIPKKDFKHCLMNASQQFYYRPTPTDGYLLAGYPWFAARTRDMLVSLPGCTLLSDAPERFERIMNTFTPLMYNFINQEEITPEIRNISDPDIGVWYVWVIQQYAQWGDLETARRKYGKAVKDIMEYYRKNIHPLARIVPNGLLYVESDGRPLTWMDAKIDDKAVVAREGYIVELNALWYNALCFLRELYPEEEETYGPLAEKAKESFVKVFHNRYDYLFDYVREEAPQDWSVRPNMIFAVSLPYSPLTRPQQRKVLEFVTRELLIPKGLRSLSPKSEGFRGICGPSQYERELSYYNGSAWPWLFGAYCESYLKVNGRAGISFIERILIGMEEEVHLHGIGTISELFDGNPPYKSRGAISFAMSVGEIIRALHLLDEAKKNEEDEINPIIQYI